MVPQSTMIAASPIKMNLKFCRTFVQKVDWLKLLLKSLSLNSICIFDKILVNPAYAAEKDT
jgi:hypothetical protein